MIDRIPKPSPEAARSFRRDPVQAKKDKGLDHKALKEACRRFEGLFVNYLLKGMRRTVSETKLIHGGYGETIWREMHDQALAEEAGKSGALGLGEILYRQLAGLDAAPSPNQAKMTARTYLEAAGPAGNRREEAEAVETVLWPVSGRISDRFGLRRHPILGVERMHNGLDIAAPEGTPVRAAADGRVTFAGWKEGYGYFVEIDHGDGLVTRYGHNRENSVEVGQRVARGQIIAKVGSTGLSTGPHVHFEVVRNGRPTDPLALLGQPAADKVKTASKSPSPARIEGDDKA